MESGEPIRPQDMDPRHLRLYVGWLKQKDWAYGNQRNHYVFTKSVLEALVRRGAIPDQKGLFPANPFPNSRSQMNGATALSHSERSRLAHVLRDELVAIREKRFEGSESAALVVMVLAVAIRTGANPTPLLEATLHSVLRPLRLFCNYVASLGLVSFGDVQPLHIANYVRIQKAKGLKSGSLAAGFLALELLYVFRDEHACTLQIHPWPGSSAREVGGHAGQQSKGPKVGLTPLIRHQLQTFRMHRLERETASVRLRN